MQSPVVGVLPATGETTGMLTAPAGNGTVPLYVNVSALPAVEQMTVAPTGNATEVPAVQGSAVTVAPMAIVAPVSEASVPTSVKAPAPAVSTPLARLRMVSASVAPVSVMGAPESSV